MYQFTIKIAILTSVFSVSIVAGKPLWDRQTAGYTNALWQRNGLIGQGPRQEHAVAAIGTDVYVLGGTGYNELGQIDTTSRVEVFDTAEERWTTAAPLPQPLNHLNVVSVNGNLYSLGGLSGGLEWTTVNSSYVYTPSNDVWTKIAPLPNSTSRGSSAVGAFNGTIYLAGGMTVLQPMNNGHQDSLSSVLAYDTVSDRWETNLPPLPGPRQHVGGVVVGNTFYVIGGRENSTTQYHNTTFALDLTRIGAGWRELAPLPTARGSITCSAIDEYIYCFGGEGNPESPLRIFNNTEVYDTRNDVWTELMPMEVPRHGTGSATVGEAIYIPGGGYHGDGFQGVPTPGEPPSPGPVSIMDSLHTS